MKGRPLIVFDLGHVLLHFDMKKAARNFDRLDPGKGKILLRHLWSSRLAVDFESGKLTGREFYEELKKRAGFRVSYAQFCWAFNEIFTPIHANLRLLRRLSRKFPTAILSNTNEVHWKYLMKNYPILKSVRWPFASHLCGHVKPDARIYKALSKRCRMPLKDMIYVDDIAKNVAAARCLGLTALHYRGGSLEKPILAALKNGFPHG